MFVQIHTYSDTCTRVHIRTGHGQVEGDAEGRRCVLGPGREGRRRGYIISYIIHNISYMIYHI